jgi:hypothetical protein
MMARLLPARRRIMDPCRVADEVVVWLCQNERRAVPRNGWDAAVWTRDRAGCY